MRYVVVICEGDDCQRRTFKELDTAIDHGRLVADEWPDTLVEVWTMPDGEKGECIWTGAE